MPRYDSPFYHVRAMPFAAWVLFGGAFLNRFGTFVIPFLVLYLTQRGFSAPQAALAISGFGIGHVGASLVGGYLADRIGRRATIALSMFGSAAVMIALSQAASYPAIVLMAGLAGLTGEMYRPASAALVGDLVTKDQRVTAFALFRLANNLGVAAGPATAGFLATGSFFLVFLGDASTSLCFGVLALAALPHTSSRAKEDGASSNGFRDALSNGPFVAFVLATLSITWIEYQIITTLPLRVRELGYPPSIFGVLISTNGAMVALFELALTAVTQRMPLRLAIASGMLLFAGGFALAGFVDTVPGLLAAVCVWTVGEMIFMPLTGAYVTLLAPPRFRGVYNGIWSSTWSIGVLLGPYLGMMAFVAEPRGYWLGAAAAGLVATLLMAAGSPVKLARSAA